MFLFSTVALVGHNKTKNELKKNKQLFSGVSELLENL